MPGQSLALPAASSSCSKTATPSQPPPVSAYDNAVPGINAKLPPSVYTYTSPRPQLRAAGAAGMLGVETERESNREAGAHAGAGYQATSRFLSQILLPEPGPRPSFPLPLSRSPSAASLSERASVPSSRGQQGHTGTAAPAPETVTETRPVGVAANAAPSASASHASGSRPMSPHSSWGAGGNAGSVTGRHAEAYPETSPRSWHDQEVADALRRFELMTEVGALQEGMLALIQERADLQQQMKASERKAEKLDELGQVQT